MTSRPSEYSRYHPNHGRPRAALAALALRGKWCAQIGSLMVRGKAAKKATPGRQGTLGVSVHPHIKKPSHVIGMQIGVLWHQRGGRTQLGARAGD